MHNNETYQNVYYGKQQLIKEFIPDEEEYLRSDSQYIQTAIPKEAVDSLVDMVKAPKATVTFSQPGINEIFERWVVDTDYEERIEQYLIDLHIYGNAFLQVTKDEMGTRVENGNIDHSYAEYNKYNFQKPAKYLYTQITDKKDDKEYILTARYYPGEITYTVEDKEGGKYNPVEIFADLLEGSDVRVRTVDGKEEYFVLTGTTYPLLFLTRLNKPANQFYGYSMFSPSVLGKVANINRYHMLARHALHLTTVPKLQMNETTGKGMIDSSIEEAKANIQPGLPESFASTGFDGRRSIWSTSFLRSAIIGTINKKLQFFTKAKGDDDSKYIEYNGSLSDLKDFIAILQSDLRSELYQSKALDDTSMTTGAKSGIAYKRLMQKTINHVENIRDLITPTLRRVIATAMELETGSIINELPSIEYPPVVEEEETTNRIQTLSNRLANARGDNQ